jgi:Peptidase propeptide and YPEB domain
MTRTRRFIMIGGAVAAIAVAGAGTAIAVSGGGDDDGEPQATGAGADRARAAALELTRGGTANAVERDSENGATWEVEVTKPDGETVDVRLDERYRLVVIESDSEHEPE